MTLRGYLCLGPLAFTLLPWMGCDSRVMVRAARPDASATVSGPEAPGALGEDLLEAFTRGDLDTAGPLVDLGEVHAQALLLTPASQTSALNGDTWAAVGARLRFRAPLGPAAEDPSLAPDRVRLRVRHAAARSVAVVIDGVLARAALLPAHGATAVLSLPVPPERFRRSVAEVELRFAGPRPNGTPAAELDWVHLVRGEVTPTRVQDLVHDVRVDGPPRRALTFFAPTALSVLRTLPAGATLETALAAEGPRGGQRPLAPVSARICAEADGVAVLERRVEVTPNRPWVPLSLDLSSLAGRPVRLRLSAEGVSTARLAVASPVLRLAPPGAVPQVLPARHVVLLVVRGLRADRVYPDLSPRLRAGGLQRLRDEGSVALALAPSVRALAALASAVTGLGADVHRVAELTDTLDEDAPTLGSLASARGPLLRAYTDEASWLGMGLERGFVVRPGCPNDAPLCRAEALLGVVAEALVREHERTSLTLVVTRAGTYPLDPSPETLTALDPALYEGTLTTAATGLLAQRGRRPSPLEPRDQDRLELLYDAALLGVDRGLKVLLDRLQAAQLLDQTLVLVTGDRGVALGEGALVGDGPVGLQSVTTTAFLARGPGIPHRRWPQALAVVDAAATALRALGAERPAELDGVALGEAPSPRELLVVTSPRGELGLWCGDVLAVPRPSGLALLVPGAEAPEDVGPSRPITRWYAERRLTESRAPGRRRVFAPSTRALPTAP